MIRMTKKAIAAISGVSVVTVGSTTVMANVALKTDQEQTQKKTNPLGRDSSYHHYPISNKIAADTRLSNLVDKIEQDRMIVYIISEEKFLSNIQAIAINALKNISAFSKTYLNYSFVCNYKIKDTKSILVDLVWFEQNSNIKYYDQFVLSLETI